ncbi:hypothetical protein DFQ27_006710 [Actinomortierella ambigua]|uniref:Uncharacterized protein n=1 Tax=Actinomortierella ambigua TaxID=1343610 RepID=A0A9P6PXR0_9FUNG|nr:hypothetical protein DFQ27_006710 [Actinomortierella ambigua]
MCIAGRPESCQGTDIAHRASSQEFSTDGQHQCYRAHYLYRIAQLHLNHAMIFFQHPEAVVKAFPEKNHHFYSLQDQAVAAMVYAQQSIKEARAAGSSRPQHLSLIIECHLILAACVTSAPLNVWYRQQALDLTQLLATQFPNHVPNKELLRVAHSIAPRDT